MARRTSRITASISFRIGIIFRDAGNFWKDTVRRLVIDSNMLVVLLVLLSLLLIKRWILCFWSLGSREEGSLLAQTFSVSLSVPWNWKRLPNTSTPSSGNDKNGICG